MAKTNDDASHALRSSGRTELVGLEPLEWAFRAREGQCAEAALCAVLGLRRRQVEPALRTYGYDPARGCSMAGTVAAAWLLTDVKPRTAPRSTWGEMTVGDVEDALPNGLWLVFCREACGSLHVVGLRDGALCGAVNPEQRSRAVSAVVRLDA